METAATTAMSGIIANYRNLTNELQYILIEVREMVCSHLSKCVILKSNCCKHFHVVMQRCNNVISYKDGLGKKGGRLKSAPRKNGLWDKDMNCAHTGLQNIFDKL